MCCIVAGAVLVCWTSLLHVFAASDRCMSLLTLHVRIVYKFQHGSSALVIAVERGNIAATTLLLERGSDIEAKNKVRGEVIDGVFMASFATLLRHTTHDASCQFAHHPNVYFLTKDGNTALHIAAMRCEKEIVTILLENGADIEAKGQVSVLLPDAVSVTLGKFHYYSLYTKDFGSFGGRSVCVRCGRTPLLMAVDYGHYFYSEGRKRMLIRKEEDWNRKTEVEYLH